MTIKQSTRLTNSVWIEYTCIPKHILTLTLSPVCIALCVLCVNVARFVVFLFKNIQSLDHLSHIFTLFFVSFFIYTNFGNRPPHFSYALFLSYAFRMQTNTHDNKSYTEKHCVAHSQTHAHSWKRRERENIRRRRRRRRHQTNRCSVVGNRFFLFISLYRLLVVWFDSIFFEKISTFIFLVFRRKKNYFESENFRHLISEPCDFKVNLNK